MLILLIQYNYYNISAWNSRSRYCQTTKCWITDTFFERYFSLAKKWPKFLWASQSYFVSLWIDVEFPQEKSSYLRLFAQSLFKGFINCGENELQQSWPGPVSTFVTDILYLMEAKWKNNQVVDTDQRLLIRGPSTKVVVLHFWKK
jgi:hypothetical protein